MKKTPLLVRVTSRGEVIGSMTPGEFIAASKAPANTFLQSAVDHFNAWKARIGEPERAEVFLKVAA